MNSTRTSPKLPPNLPPPPIDGMYLDGIPGLLKGNICGLRNPDGVGFRITENQDGEAEFGEWVFLRISFLKIVFSYFE